MINSDLRIIIVVIALFGVRSSFAQYPRIPCPDIFRYAKSSEGYYGKISLDGITYGVTLVEVELSQPGQKNPDFTGKVELAIDLDDVRNYIETEQAIPFNVLFQYPDVIPSVTAIRLNGASICSGPKVSLRPRVNIRLKRTLTIHDPNEKTSERTTTLENYRNNPDLPLSISSYLPALTTTTKTTKTTTTTPIPTTSTPSATTTRRTTSTTKEPQTPETTSRPLLGTLEYINYYCGIENYNSSTTRLGFRGEAIRQARFPWIAAIFKKNIGEVKFLCGASLISTTTIVSAAHCFYDGAFPIRDSDILVSLGRHDLSDWADPNTIQRNVELVIQHPDYRHEIGKSDADVAIARLQYRVGFSYYVRPICLWKGNNDLEDLVGLLGVVVGWGRDELSNNPSRTPKLFNATIASDETCLQSDDQFFFATSNRTMCAGNLDGSGPCTGDSGSGLMLQIGKKWMLRGIVASALANANTPCDLKKYVIYSDTVHFLDWIRGNMLL